MDQPKYRWASKVLYGMAINQQTRLLNGSKLRKEMYEQIKRGEEPTGYRADWLRDSSMLVIDFLKDIAQDFNNKYPQDQASVSDLTDILATAMNLLQKKSK